MTASDHSTPIRVSFPETSRIKSRCPISPVRKISILWQRAWTESRIYRPTKRLRYPPPTWRSAPCHPLGSSSASLIIPFTLHTLSSTNIPELHYHFACFWGILWCKFKFGDTIYEEDETDYPSNIVSVMVQPPSGEASSAGLAQADDSAQVQTSSHFFFIKSIFAH